MAENSKIEWCHHTFNPWIGCTKVGPGCDHCYAEADFDKRRHVVSWGAGQPRKRTAPSTWALPLKWDAEAERLGVRYRVFCASLADVFDNEVPAEWRRDLFDLIASTPRLDWLLVTKRIGNAMPMLAGLTHSNDHDLRRLDMMPLPNVWIGATITSQAEADRDIPKLLAVPAAVRFLSMEPLLGPVDLFDYVPNPFSCSPRASARSGPFCDEPAVDWVIVGGESGSAARPMHPNWARSLRDQCADAGVPFLFKQWGEWLPGQNDPHPYAKGRKVAHHQDGSWGATDTKVNARNYVAWDAAGNLHRGSLIDAPSTLRVQAWAERVGKKAAGRLLDGVQHDGYPAHHAAA